MKLLIDNWRWAGVPFFLRTGTRLASRSTHSVIELGRALFVLLREHQVDDLMSHQRIMHIQPEEGISFRFAPKPPGPAMRLGHVDMDFNFFFFIDPPPPTFYALPLHDFLPI